MQKCCQLTKVYRSNIRKVYQSQLQSQNVNHSINEDVVQLYAREKKTPALAISTHVSYVRYEKRLLPSTQCSTSSRLRSVILIRLELSISSFLWVGHM